METLLATASIGEAGWAYGVIALAVLLIGVTKSGFGAGVGLIIVPVTTLAMARTGYGEKAALGLLLPLLILGDLVAVYQYRRLLDARLLRALAWPTGVGVVVGAVLLWCIHVVGGRSEAWAAALIRMEIGLECVILVGLHYYTQLRARRAQRAAVAADTAAVSDPGVNPAGETRLMPEPARSWISGVYAGVSSTLAHAAGPVIALYLLPKRLPREVFVGTCAAYFFALNAAKLPAYFVAGQFGYMSPGFALGWMPLVLVGAVLGRWIVQRVSDKAFAQIVYSSTMVMGFYLVVDAGVRIGRLV